MKISILRNYGILYFGVLIAAKALGIGAASFWSAAEKVIAESPTAIAGTPQLAISSQ